MKTGKTKSTAVLLATLLGFWAFLYSYEVDKRKFWLSLVLSLTTLASGITFSIAFLSYSASYGNLGLDDFAIYVSDVLAGAPVSRGGNQWAKQSFPLANWSLLATILTAGLSWSMTLITTLKRPWTFFEKL